MTRDELVERARALLGNTWGAHKGMCMVDYAKAIDAMLAYGAEQRAQAIEEAEGVCKNLAEEIASEGVRGASWWVRKAESEIRALRQPAAKEQGPGSSSRTSPSASMPANPAGGVGQAAGEQADSKNREDAGSSPAPGSIHAPAPAPRWTSEAPTVPGWYWQRWDSSGTPRPFVLAAGLAFAGQRWSMPIAPPPVESAEPEPMKTIAVRDVPGAPRGQWVETAPDVFEAAAREWKCSPDETLEFVLRRRFSGVVSTLEMIARHPCHAREDAKLLMLPNAKDYHCGECAACVAKEAVEELRAPAQKEAPREA